MKNIIIIILLLFYSFFSYTEQLNTYSFIPVKVIQTGSEEGKIGWQASPSGYTGPTTMYIDKNSIIYVPDRVNNRINLYDLDINFLKTIIEKEKKYAHFTNKMKVDENGNIIYISTKAGLQKIDPKGNNLFTIKYKILPRNVKNRQNFFPINDVIFIYDDNNEIEYITSEGEIISGEKITSKITELTDKMESKESQMNIILLPAEQKKIIQELKNNKILLIGTRLYSTNFSKNQEYFNKIKEIRKYIISQKKEADKKNIDINIEDFSMHFIDYDEKHNSYWQGIINKPDDIKKYAVIIYSKYGELLDAFYYGQYNDHEPNYNLYPTTEAIVAVAPIGDVYFLIGNSKEYTFYKVENNW
jgi:hypothetical protein